MTRGQVGGGGVFIFVHFWGGGGKDVVQRFLAKSSLRNINSLVGI